MNITKMSIWGHIQRPWGYEVRFDYQDQDTGQIYNDSYTWPTQPNQTEIDKVCDWLLQRLIDQANAPPPVMIDPVEAVRIEYEDRIAQLEQEKQTLIAEKQVLASEKSILEGELAVIKGEII